ncbi:hypothetical protein IU450_36595 [Nocardia abscessus]|uniref:hypothetical protein n=1 Tax=Nocardia abscessus TaxID=120957 RepID=UPI00189318FB|nr:hypothetical protein [Nocardia abscessus]MBF6341362.1 hypothetical protein [Nocardia abscessus]
MRLPELGTGVRAMPVSSEAESSQAVIAQAHVTRAVVFDLVPDLLAPGRRD